MHMSGSYIGIDDGTYSSSTLKGAIDHVHAIIVCNITKAFFITYYDNM